MMNEETLPAMTVTKIGSVDQQDNGTDEYLLVTSDDNISPAEVREYLMGIYYTRSSQPGAYFCDSVHAVRAQYQRNTVIATVYHRYDI